MSNYKTIAVQQHVDITLVHFTDAKMLDHEQIVGVRSELLDLANDRKPKKVVINFGGITFCSSELISALMLFWKRIASDGGQIRLAGMNDNIREVFIITRLDGTVFEIFPTANDAMQDF